MKTPRKRSPKPARRRPASGVPRLSAQDGQWYWKPSADLRPAFRTVALGCERPLAEAEAIRLNRQVDAWRASPARTPAARPVRSGPASVGMLIAAYQNSADWQRLAARTRVTYHHELGVLAAQFADSLAATLTFRQVDDWLDDLRMRSPDTARHIVARGRALFNWAARKEMIPAAANPFAKARAPAPRRRGVRLAWDDVRQMVTTADAMGYPSIGTALVLAFACVQRITDVIALEHGHLAGGRLVFRQHKSERRLSARRIEPGKQVDMELPSVVRERLAAAPGAAGTGSREPLLVCETTGRPWHEKTIGRVFRRIVVAARKQRPAIPADAQLRDGRRSGFVHYVTAGASIPWVCSISGHSIEDGYEIVEHYLPRTAENADQAVALFRAAW